MQLLLIVPCLAIVPVLSTLLFLAALPMYVFALFTGRVPEWWSREAPPALAALARGASRALLGPDWRCDVRARDMPGT